MEINAWTNPKNGQPRYYINDWFDALDIDIETYKTGNVSRSYIRGEKIAHRRAQSFLTAKIWLDTDDKMHFDRWPEELYPKKEAEPILREAMAAEGVTIPSDEEQGGDLDVDGTVVPEHKIFDAAAGMLPGLHRAAREATTIPAAEVEKDIANSLWRYEVSGPRVTDAVIRQAGRLIGVHGLEIVEVEGGYQVREVSE